MQYTENSVTVILSEYFVCYILSTIQVGTACEVAGDSAAVRLAVLGFLDSCACKPAKPVLSWAAASLPSRS